MTTVDNIQLKRAWQTAFQLRLCPDGNLLFAEAPDEDLMKHLQICHVCREKREMPLTQRAAWEDLQQRMAFAAPKPAKPEMQVAGQVWSLKRSLAAWGDDGYFYKPPMVLLLERIENSGGFKVVQLYGDRLLMGEGDVWLDNDRFGFAQGWNCYCLHDEALEGCWGAASEEVLERVLEASTIKHVPVEEDSILYFFRRMESSVGAKVALPSVAVLVEEWEGVTREVVPGILRIVNGWLEVTAEAIRLLQVAFKPPLTLRGATAKRSALLGAPKLTEKQTLTLMEDCLVVPIKINFTGDEILVVLKWLAQYPTEPPKIYFSLYGREISGAQWKACNSDIAELICKHEEITNIRNHNVGKIAVKYSDKKLYIDVKR